MPRAVTEEVYEKQGDGSMVLVKTEVHTLTDAECLTLDADATLRELRDKGKWKAGDIETAVRNILYVLKPPAETPAPLTDLPRKG